MNCVPLLVHVEPDVWSISETAHFWEALSAVQLAMQVIVAVTISPELTVNPPMVWTLLHGADGELVQNNSQNAAFDTEPPEETIV